MVDRHLNLMSFISSRQIHTFQNILGLNDKGLINTSVEIYRWAYIRCGSCHNPRDYRQTSASSR